MLKTNSDKVSFVGFFNVLEEISLSSKKILYIHAPAELWSTFWTREKKKAALWDLPNRHVALACNKANIYIKHNTAIYLDA